jgi:hypothetical protein
MKAGIYTPCNKRTMPSISTDALLEYFIWMVIIYILPTFVSAALVTTTLNSERARSIFGGGIQLVNLKVNEWILHLEGIHSFRTSSSESTADGTRRRAL